MTEERKNSMFTMNLETKYDDNLGLVIVDVENNQQYVCSDKADMDILCQRFTNELNHIILRHNLVIKTMIKIEDNLKEASVFLDKMKKSVDDE